MDYQHVELCYYETVQKNTNQMDFSQPGNPQIVLIGVL